MRYIHQRTSWPSFTWDTAAISPVLASVRHKQGRLLGRMESLGFELRKEATLTTLTSDVVKSSAIEGENLNPSEVRSSIARRLGLDAAGLPPASRDVDAVVEMMLDATQHFDQPLTPKRLFDWHATLFPTGRSGLHRITIGAWRTDANGPMQVVSGPVGREKVHFEAPSAGRLEHEMARFLSWFEIPSELDPVIRAAIAHLWFVTIHPFDDGNGRIARAITDMALARSDATKERFYSMSGEIERQRNGYYNALESQQMSDTDITPWISWFLACLARAIDAADAALNAILRKARTWERINRMLGDFEGFLNTSKYAKLAKCSPDTALRDITELLDRAILVKNEKGGRSTSYRLNEPDAIKP